ncbi:MAG: nitroreductase [Parasphingorhabdus sp.]|jgi:nitroreductase
MQRLSVEQALRQRKSTRAFLNKTVERATIDRILGTASQSPSGANTQPWEVAVISGSSKARLEQKLVEAFQQQTTRKMDYHYYPEVWQEPFKSRQFACGMQLYETLDIQRKDRQRRTDQWIANYRSFDAPMMLMFFINRDLETGSYFDMGMFLQSIMLMACHEGLATCPQAALGEFPDVVRSELGYDTQYNVVCGMAMGYEDTTDKVNSYRTPRDPVKNFTRYFT